MTQNEKFAMLLRKVHQTGDMAFLNDMSRKEKDEFIIFLKVVQILMDKKM